MRKLKHDEWEDEIEEKNEELMNLYAQYEPKAEDTKNSDTKLNPQQSIFVGMLKQLRPGMLFQGKVKEIGKNSYYVDIGVLDVLCIKRKGEELNPKQLIDVVILTIEERKASAIRLQNLPLVEWKNDRVKIIRYNHSTDEYDEYRLDKFEMTNLEKEIIKEYCNKTEWIEKPHFYHKNFKVVTDLRYAAPLLQKNMYDVLSYNNGDVDPKNPNFDVDEFGNVSFKRYTQQPFYSLSSKVRNFGLHILF